MKRSVGLAVVAFILLAAAPHAHAQDEASFSTQLRDARQHRLLIEARLGVKAHEDIYDVADHYTGDQMMHQVPEDLGVFLS